MKYIYATILLWTCINFNSTAQLSLNVTLTGDTSVLNANPLVALESFASLKNTSHATLNLKVKRKVIYEVAGSENYFCWDLCYGTSTDISDGTLNIMPDSTNTAFYGHYKSNQNIGTSMIQYCFFNPNNSADSVCYTTAYSSGVAGVGDLISTKIVSKAFPIPAKESVSLYIGNGTTKETINVKLTELSGKVVSSQLVILSNGKADIDLSGISNGVYFYIGTTQNNKTFSGKLAIQN